MQYPEPEVPGDTSSTTVYLRSLGDSSLSLWNSGTIEATPGGELKTSLSGGEILVIGRQNGGETPYLDPQYRPTPFVPNASGTILVGRESDTWVSRGHFMLRSWPGGLVLVNGVPRRGGGIRPPLNWTWLLAPECRKMEPGEEYPISRGKAVEIKLPNETRIGITAE